MYVKIPPSKAEITAVDTENATEQKRTRSTPFLHHKRNKDDYYPICYRGIPYVSGSSTPSTDQQIEGAQEPDINVPSTSTTVTNKTNKTSKSKIRIH